MSVTGFQRRRRLQAKAAKAPQPESIEQQRSVAQAPEDRRAFLLDEIERLSGKRPGGNSKTETLEQRYAELAKE